MEPTLSSCELLAGLAPADAEQFLAVGRVRRLGQGDVLFDLGTEADSLYVITRGRVSLTLPMELRGRTEDVLIEDRGPGEAVGWSALVPPHRFTLKATAPLPVELLALPRTRMVEFFTAHPDAGYLVARNVAAVIGQRLHVFQAMWLREIQRVVNLTHA